MTSTRRLLKPFAATLLLGALMSGPPTAAPQTQARRCPINARSDDDARCPRPAHLVSVLHRDFGRS